MIIYFCVFFIDIYNIYTYMYICNGQLYRFIFLLLVNNNFLFVNRNIIIKNKF